MKKHILVMIIVLLSGCAGQTPSVDTPEKQNKSTSQTTEASTRLEPTDCEYHSTLPDSAEQFESPGTRNETPTQSAELSDVRVSAVAVEYHATVLTRQLRNRTDITDFGIGPGTTTTAAAVTRRSDMGACVVVRVPYYVEPTAGGIVDDSSVATYFVNRSVIVRTG